MRGRSKFFLKKSLGLNDQVRKISIILEHIVQNLRGVVPLVHYKIHGPIHDPYHPNFELYHC